MVDECYVRPSVRLNHMENELKPSGHFNKSTSVDSSFVLVTDIKMENEMNECQLGNKCFRVIWYPELGQLHYYVDEWIIF